MYDGVADHVSHVGRSGLGPRMVTRKTGPSPGGGDVTTIAGVSARALRIRSIFAASPASAGRSCASMSVRNTTGGIRVQTTESFRRPAFPSRAAAPASRPGQSRVLHVLRTACTAVDSQRMGTPERELGTGTVG
jgi:hypothetical protein